MAPAVRVRFEGNANTVNIQYNSIHNNAGPGVAADSSGVTGDSSGFVVNNNDIYSNNGIGLLTIANAYDGPVIAVNDWWGNATGPGGDGPGTGQAVWANGVSGHGVSPRGSAGGTITFSPWATALIDITKIPAPAAPIGLNATIVSSSQIGLTWTPQMSTALNQVIQRSTDGVNYTTIATVSPLINSYADAGLTSLAYYYRVIAANQTGNSPASNVASTLPASPTGVTAMATSQTRVIVAWTDSSSAIENGFIIQRSTDGVNFALIGTVATGVTTFADTTAQAGNTYLYRVIATGVTGNSAASATATATTPAANALSTALSSLNWTSATTGYGTIQKNASISGNTITLRGTTYSSGIGTHAASTIVYNLGGAYTNFISDVGIDDEEIGKGTGAVDFQVIGDGKVLFDSGVLTNSSPVVSINVSVVGVNTLTLVANNGVANSIDYDHADWAGATSVQSKGACCSDKCDRDRTFVDSDQADLVRRRIRSDRIQHRSFNRRNDLESACVRGGERFVLQRHWPDLGRHVFVSRPRDQQRRRFAELGGRQRHNFVIYRDQHQSQFADLDQRDRRLWHGAEGHEHQRQYAEASWHKLRQRYRHARFFDDHLQPRWGIYQLPFGCGHRR